MPIEQTTTRPVRNTLYMFIFSLSHLHHAGLHVHLVQRERLLCLVASDLSTQALHVTVQLPLEILQRRLFDAVHQNVVLGFNLNGEKQHRIKV